GEQWSAAVCFLLWCAASISVATA
ncbi:unnamed protein product, partial [Cuscuta campestris]